MAQAAFLPDFDKGDFYQNLVDTASFVKEHKDNFDHAVNEFSEALNSDSNGVINNLKPATGLPFFPDFFGKKEKSYSGHPLPDFDRTFE